ncbi:hypothetical protein BGZ80_004709, partial [Entomortierella chlamydospora]
VLTFTHGVTIDDIAPRTVEWIIMPETAILDHLRKVIYDKRSQIVVLVTSLTNSALQTRVEMSVRNGVKHLVLRLDHPKLFSDIILDDPSRLYCFHVDPPHPFNNTRTRSFTSDVHVQALDDLYITLETAIASMQRGDTDVPGSRYYTNAFHMQAVALFSELKMKQEKTGWTTSIRRAR